MSKAAGLDNGLQASALLAAEVCQPPQSSFGQGIDHLDEGKPMKVCVPGANPPNAVFAHQDCGVGVMQEVAGQVGKFGKDLSGHLGVP